MNGYNYFTDSIWKTQENVEKENLRKEKITEKSTRSFLWILVYDASVKIPLGVITGNYQQLGNYDECLQVKSKYGFTGKACSATVNFEIAKDNGKPRQPDMGDLLLNIAIASVSKILVLLY